jgi:hypothetical protein
MASFYFYFFIGILLPIVIGGLMAFVFYLFFDYWRKNRLAKKYLAVKGNKEALANGGNVNKTEKEVQDNERGRITKFREYEKLRELGFKTKRNGGVGGTQKQNRSHGSNAGIQRPGVLQHDAGFYPSDNLKSLGQPTQGSGKDKQVFTLPKPD